MEVFYVIAGVAVLGILLVLWLLKNDKDADDQPRKIEKLLPDHVFDHNKLPEIDLTSAKAPENESSNKKKGFLGGLFKPSKKKII